MFVLFLGGLLSFQFMNAIVMAQPAFCKTCHNMQYEYDTYAQEGLLAHKHAEANVTCHDCHEPSMAQQMNEGWFFVTGQYDNPTKRYGFTNEQCLSCHKWEDVVEKTKHLGANSPHNGVLPVLVFSLACGASSIRQSSVTQKTKFPLLTYLWLAVGFSCFILASSFAGEWGWDF